MKITLETICQILAGSLTDAKCRVEAGYIILETGSQTIRLSLDYVRR